MAEIPMANLPREVLRWVQSLDLAYSVKNARRDFSNGFLVAEIFSRYYARDIQMHSFDNGNSAKSKKDNWLQLIKVLRRIGIHDLITEEQAHLIACVEDGAAITLLCKLYETLTQRKIQTQVKKPSIGRVAGYARDISLTKVRKAMQQNDLGEDSDIYTSAKILSNVVEEHERNLQGDRANDPERFSLASIGTKQIQAPPKSHSDDEGDVPQVRIKEIQVKQLDRNVTHLRASKHMQGGGAGSPSNKAGARSVSPLGNEYGGALSNESFSPIGGGGGGGSGGFERYAGGGGGGGAGGSNGTLVPENSASLMNSCLSRAMPAGCHPAWAAHFDPYQNFMSGLDLLTSGTALDDLLTQALGELKSSASMLADACVVSPKQFWKVSDLLCSSLIIAPHDSKSFLKAAEAFESIGKLVALRDSAASISLFSDFSLFKLAPALIRNSHKRLHILKILHAFSAPDPQCRVMCIKRLQAVVPDLTIFIHCLTILSANESQFDDLLMDLYLYYASIGLSMPSPKIRSAALSVLNNLLPQAEGTVIGMLPQLYSLVVADSWWEIHAQILNICGLLLEMQAARTGGAYKSRQQQSEGKEYDDGEDQTVQMILKIVMKSFNSDSPTNIKMWGVFSLAPGTGINDVFARLYVDILHQLDPSSRQFLLGMTPIQLIDGKKPRNSATRSKSIQLPSCTGLPYLMDPISTTWNALNIARAVEFGVVSNNSADRLTTDQMVTLHACVLSVTGSNVGYENIYNPSRNSNNSNGFATDDDSDDMPLSGQWIDLYQSLKDYVFVGLCDINIAANAVGILNSFIYASRLRDTVLKENRFIAILRLLYPSSGEVDKSSGLPACQAVLEQFLRDVFASGKPCDGAVHGVLTLFSKNYSTNFEKSVPLQRLLRDFGSKLK